MAPTIRTTLYHGNCIDILGGLPPASVDLIVTDPPYVCRYRSRDGRQVANDDRSSWIAPAFQQMHRVLKDDSFCLSFYGWNHVEKFMLAFKRAGFTPVGHLVFSKRYASRTGYLESRHEQAFLLAKGNPAKPAKPLPDVLPWAYSGNALHPTQKAVKVIAPLIETFSKPGDVVLDPFMGSGTTGVACAELQRRFIGIELDAAHSRVACRRVREAYGPPAQAA